MSAPVPHEPVAAASLEWCGGPGARSSASAPASPAPASPSPVSLSPASPPTLDALRARIEAIDAQLVTLVAERQRIAAAVGEVKRASEQPVLDLAREAAVLRRVAELAREAALDEEDARELWRKLLAMARRVQADDRRPAS